MLKQKPKYILKSKTQDIPLTPQQFVNNMDMFSGVFYDPNNIPTMKLNLNGVPEDKDARDYNPDEVSNEVLNNAFSNRLTNSNVRSLDDSLRLSSDSQVSLSSFAKAGNEELPSRIFVTSGKSNSNSQDYNVIKEDDAKIPEQIHCSSDSDDLEISEHEQGLPTFNNFEIQTKAQALAYQNIIEDFDGLDDVIGMGGYDQHSVLIAKYNLLIDAIHDINMNTILSEQQKKQLQTMLNELEYRDLNIKQKALIERIGTKLNSSDPNFNYEQWKANNDSNYRYILSQCNNDDNIKENMKKYITQGLLKHMKNMLNEGWSMEKIRSDADRYLEYYSERNISLNEEQKQMINNQVVQGSHASKALVSKTLQVNGDIDENPLYTITEASDEESSSSQSNEGSKLLLNKALHCIAETGEILRIDPNLYRKLSDSEIKQEMLSIPELNQKINQNIIFFSNVSTGVQSPDKRQGLRKTQDVAKPSFQNQFVDKKSKIQQNVVQKDGRPLQGNNFQTSSTKIEKIKEKLKEKYGKKVKSQKINLNNLQKQPSNNNNGLSNLSTLRYDKQTNGLKAQPIDYKNNNTQKNGIKTQPIGSRVNKLERPRWK